MSDARQAFVDAILAEPENESHRLIFSDWLEENGDLKRAEGLRVLSGLAGIWSSDWGQDQYGLWCAFSIKGVSQKMRWIPPGKFWMGSPEDEEGRHEDEGPRHEVELTHGFWLADTPCTQAMWEVIMGGNPSHFQDQRRPVERVSFTDCMLFLEEAGSMVGGLEPVLPTEAQWEYACRAGTTGTRYLDDLDSMAWYDGNCRGETRPVGEKLPNAWGLYDTVGNVWEWCRDGGREYTKERVIEPEIPPDESLHYVIRGGSCILPAPYLRAASRWNENTPDTRHATLGFRFSVPVPGVES